jgi:hypothetical protein
LTEAGWGAKNTKNTFLSARYSKLVVRRGKKKAIIAIGHSILISIFHILSRNEPYKELGADYLLNGQQAKRKVYLLKELEKLGYQTVLQKHPQPAQLTPPTVNKRKQGRFLLTPATQP